MTDDDFTTRYIPFTAERESVEAHPFVVAYERGGGYKSGDRLAPEQFEAVLEDYDAVIVHRKEGPHPSQKNHFLLYGEAKQALDAEERIATVEKRDRSHEVTGKVRWFVHGKELAVDTTIGLHCLSEDVWEGLP